MICLTAGIIFSLRMAATLLPHSQNYTIIGTKVNADLWTNLVKIRYLSVTMPSLRDLENLG
ncbi:MAG: hypothetical protein ABR980_14525, partial [Ignavibacteriaceae bacterium]